jgi:hypothetical protein
MGHLAVEEFIDELIDIVHAEAPDCLVTFANYPSTEFLNPHNTDFVCFNVYLHDDRVLRNYLARLQSIAQDKPLMLGEYGIDTLKEHSEEKQAEILEKHIRAVFDEGLVGTFIFSYTDDWFTGGYQIENWAFGITRRDRTPKPACDALKSILARVPQTADIALPMISVIICSYNGASTVESCLRSMQRLQYPNYEVIFVDDGSADRTPEILQQFKDCRWLRVITQKNMGLSYARNVGMNAAKGEIIAYTDSDVLFAPGWLSRSVQVLETYPNVGMVTSRPFRTQENLSSATIEWAQRTPETDYQVGQFLSWEDFSSFVMSLGTSEEQTREWYASGGDMRVNYRGVPAQIGASHWQFLAYKTVLQTMLPFDMSRPMGQVRMLDQRINEMGMLRLMTAEPLAQNMSNQAPERAKARAQQKAQSNNPMKRRLLDSRPVKAALLRIYDRIFDAYYR